MIQITKEQARIFLDAAIEQFGPMGDGKPYIYFDKGFFFFSPRPLKHGKVVLNYGELKSIIENLEEDNEEENKELCVHAIHESCEEFLFREFGEEWFNEYLKKQNEMKR